ncbi:FtsH protease activity modulator HflK [Candidatus Fermentibacterales bacterium]|nr:FtsH protease activity modulator HflK [Candidatus Fermentibacterales bacterium]
MDQGPDFDQFFRKEISLGRYTYRRLLQRWKKGKLVLVYAVILVVAVVVLKPWYIVGPQQAGVLVTFGKHTETTGPGFHLKWPWPIQTVLTPEVNVVKRLEIGFRTVGDNQYVSFNNDREMLMEAQSLTGDENIVNVAFIVQYKIRDPHEYLFVIRDGDETLRDIAEASMRLVIGDNCVDAALTTGKFEMQERARQLIQDLCDRYRCGLHIVAVQLMDVQPPAQVSAAFRDVATAREDKSAYINEAEAYRNEQIPDALADSVTAVNRAMGYRTERVNLALGESERFTAVAEEYRKAPEVTAARLHLEALRQVFSQASLTVVDENAGALTHYGLGGGQ